jgi:hypothetical protein
VIEELTDLDPNVLGPAHCVRLQAAIRLAAAFPERRVPNTVGTSYIFGLSNAKVRHSARRVSWSTDTGYKWGGEGVNRWVEIDEATAPIVRRAFAEYATGNHSSRELAARLNAEGMVGPARCGPTELRGHGWYGVTLMYMLANVAYIGKTYSVSQQRQEGELIDAKWTAVIDIATWEAVQRQHLRKLPGGGDVVAARPPRAYAFQRILRCTCGRRLYVQSGKGGTYYRCRGAEFPDLPSRVQGGVPTGTAYSDLSS